MEVPDFAAARVAGVLGLEPIPADAFVRLTRKPKTEPYFGKNASGRFDDPRQQFGVLYVAANVQVAFAETVLHEDSIFVAGRWRVSAADLHVRTVVSFTRDKPLVMLKLFGEHLKALGLNNDVSAGSGPHVFTQAISAAVHADLPDCDGILYASRQSNMDVCAALFERSGVRLATAIPLLEHPMTEEVLRSFKVIYLGPASEP